MYRAKEQGRNTFQFYSEQLSADSVERLTLEARLRRALERDELVLHYQPEIEALHGTHRRHGGARALAASRKWACSRRRISSRLAEETGLIVPIGEWVLSKRVRSSSASGRAAPSAARIAVNLSPRQFLHAHLVKDTSGCSTDTGCRGHYLELEITEGMVMHDPSGAVALIEELKAIGVRIAMDDFGTGYSSLAYLKRFPIDSLKIDRSFIADVPDDAGNTAITQAIIAMARTLRLKVIAEGVETAAQFDFLRSRGCDEVQGYYFSPPLAFAEATTLLMESVALGSKPSSS